MVLRGEAEQRVPPQGLGVSMDFDMIVGFILSVIRQTTPLLFVALGVLIIQTSGIMEMSAEGKMLLASFIAAVVTFVTGSVWLGMLIATLASGLIGLLYAWIVQEFNVNQIIMGLSFNILALGITSLIFRQYASARLSASAMLPTFEFRPLGLSLPVYIGFIMVIVVSLFLKKTNLGLKIRSVGEFPKAVESVGLSVKKIRYQASLLGSLLIGFGGAFFTLGITNVFVENMVNGRGYIAMTAVTFGKFTPGGTLAAVALFGAGDALQFRLQAIGFNIPFQFALMMPYVITVIALVLFARSQSSPSALGKTYVRE